MDDLAGNITVTTTQFFKDLHDVFMTIFWLDYDIQCELTSEQENITKN